MSDHELYLLRMVIQQLSVSPNAAYRVIVYGDSQRPQHSDFSSAQILLDTISAAIPDFDLSKLKLNPLGEEQGSIVFTDEMKLDETQLSLLGLC